VRRRLGSPRLQSSLVYLAILATVFTATLIAGFVFTHEPQRETVSVVVGEVFPDPPTARTIAGVIASIDGGFVALQSGERLEQIDLPPDVPVDDLVRAPAEGAPFAAGTVVNIGTADTNNGFILTGVVAVEGATR
jgi:hypothetical protein